VFQEQFAFYPQHQSFILPSLYAYLEMLRISLTIANFAFAN
jgi:hypothetical protein